MKNAPSHRSLIDRLFSSGMLLKLAAIFLITAGFAYINHNYLSTELYEVGDFAANSLLIQHAKHLDLLIGNYSRVGFNHPGPAILYVLAFGEWLFYDCLGLVKAPFAGQLIGEGLYTAFWIVMLATLLIRMYRSIAVAGTALILFLAATTSFDHNILTGLWFPNLYYFPFATFTLALVLLIAGRGDSLLILAISCGFLIHGHVSFVAICGLMLLGALWSNSRQAGHDLETKRVLSRAFVADHREKFLVVGFIFILFFSPLLIETIKNFPGPIVKYISFGQGNHHHSFSNALQFTATYWATGFTPLLIAISALLMFARNNSIRKDDSSPHARPAPSINRAAISAALLWATAALTFYAMYGVDDLKLVYIGLFYYSAPAFALALIIATFLLRRPRAMQIAIAIVVAATALPYIIRQAAKPVGYAFYYHDKNIAQYFDQVRSLSDHVIVLDLDDSQDWVQTWSTLLGIEAYAARHGNDQLFCVNKKWHISFTTEARCTEEQVRSRDRYVVSTATKLAANNTQQNIIDLSGIRFYQYPAVDLTANQMFSVANNQTLYASGILDNGWSTPEGEFVWSEGKQAKLAIRVGLQTPPSRIKFDLAAFLPHGDSLQEAGIFINDIEAGKIHFDTTDNRALRTLTLTPDMLANNGVITVRFAIDNPVSPQASSGSKDNRLLGIALYGIEIEN